MHRAWRPANGLEAASFACLWCQRCGKQTMSGRSCPIMDRAAAHQIGHPDFPKEFVVLDGRPRCAAFVEIGRPEAAGPIADIVTWRIPL